jgi:aspartate/methionine/tyrosine aminotransferase
LSTLEANVPQPASHLDARADLFAAPTYSSWVRRTMRAVSDRPDAAVIYGSSITEPTDELVEIIRKSFSPSVTDRFTSVFADGNRYVARALSDRYGVSEDRIVTTTGATGALSVVLAALIKSGDQVIVERPTLDLLYARVRASGAQLAILDRKGPDYGVDLDALAALMTDRTRLVLLTNLHNPTGRFLRRPEIAEIAVLVAQRGAILVVDEVYADFVRPVCTEPAAVVAPNILSVNSLTKVFGLHALKCGWIIGSPELLSKIQDESQDGDPGISTVSHAIAAHVLESAAQFDQRWQNILKHNQPILLENAALMNRDGLIQGSIPPFGCMYFPKIVGASDTIRLARKLWENFGVIVAPGEYFGTAGHVRIGFGGDADTLNAGLVRLRDALLRLRRAGDLS